jgi:hypothetical protein
VTPINWDSVFDLIQTSKVPDWSQELVAAAVTSATEHFWEKDHAQKVIGVELFGRDPFPYKIDLILGNGHIVVRDWKTKKAGKLDSFWEDRERRSWQSKIYGAAVATKFGPEVFPIHYELVGVTLEEKPKIKVLEWKIDREAAVEAVHFLRSVTAMRRALVDRNHTPWTRDPSGCRCFGPLYKCEAERFCWEGAKLPDHDPDKVEKAFSHSSAQEFLRCPERHRLFSIMGKELDDNDAGAAGDTFHRAMEMIYTTRLEEKV